MLGSADWACTGVQGQNSDKGDKVPREERSKDLKKAHAESSRLQHNTRA